MFPAPKVVSGFTSCVETFSKGFDGLLYVHDSLVQRDASESLYRKNCGTA